MVQMHLFFCVQSPYIHVHQLQRQTLCLHQKISPSSNPTNKSFKLPMLTVACSLPIKLPIIFSPCLYVLPLLIPQLLSIVDLLIWHYIQVSNQCTTYCKSSGTAGNQACSNIVHICNSLYFWP